MRGLVDRDLVQRRPLDFGMRSLHALGFPRLYVGAFPIARRFGSAEADRLGELLIAHPTPDGHARRVETSAEITDQQIVGFARSSDSGTHALGPFPALAGVGPSRDAAAILGGFGGAATQTRRAYGGALRFFAFYPFQHSGRGVL